MFCSLFTFHFLLPLRTSFTHGRDWAKVKIFLLEKCEEAGSHIASMSLYIMAQWGLFSFYGELAKLQIIRSVVSKRDFQLCGSCISIFVFCIILMHITCNLQALLRRIACANLLPGGIFSVYFTATMDEWKESNPQLAFSPLCPSAAGILQGFLMEVATSNWMCSE